MDNFTNDKNFILSAKSTSDNSGHSTTFSNSKVSAKVLDYLKNLIIKNKLYYSCYLLSILFLINCFVPKFCFFVYDILIIFILIGDLTFGFNLIIYCIPFCNIDFNIGTISFFICLLVYVIKSYTIFFVKEKKKIPLSVLITISCLVLYCILPIGGYNLQKIIKIIILVTLILILFIFIQNSKSLNLRTTLRLLAISLTISSIFFLSYFISPYIHNREIWIEDYGFIRFTALFTNPNILAMVCEISLGFLTYLILSNKVSKLDLLPFIVFSCLGLSTISKTFLLIFIFLIIVNYLYLIIKHSSEMLIITVAVTSLLILLLFFKNNFILFYLKRFIPIDFNNNLPKDEILNAVTTDRFGLWMSTIKYLTHNHKALIFGRGLGAPRLSFESTHNFYLSLIYQLGLVGAILMVVVFILILFEPQIKKEKKFNPAIFIPIIVFAMIMMVEDLFLYIY